MQQPTGVFTQAITEATLVDVMFIYTSGAVDGPTVTQGDLRFVEVSLYACTRGYESRVVTGVKTTTQVVSAESSSSSSSRILLSNGNLTLNAAWNVDKFVNQSDAEFTCRPGIGGQTVSLAPPAAEVASLGGRYELDLCTAYMTSSVINQYLASFVALREGDKIVLQVRGMTSSALGSALYGGFLGAVPSAAKQVENLRGMARNVADGLTNMFVSLFLFFSPFFFSSLPTFYLSA